MRSKIYRIVRVSGAAPSVIVERSGSDLISGQTSIELENQWDSLTVQSTGAAWVIIARINASVVTV
jgi:hypothetical protein